MIPIWNKTYALVSLHKRLSGLAEGWKPELPAPASVPVGTFSLSRPRRRAIGVFRLETPRHRDVTGIFQQGTPERAEIEGWGLGEAAAHTIGWFDLARWQEILSAPREETSGDSDSSGPRALSPAADFIRRLAAALQPPLSALTAPHGVLDWPAPLLGYQREGIATLLARRELLLADDMGLGKAQPLTAKILTPTGWVVMGNIRVGDEVINSQGGVSRVTGIYPQGEKEIYCVEFTDGSHTECCEDHLWQVNSPVRRYRNAAPHVLSLAQIRRHLVCRNGNRQHFIPLVRPIDFEESPDVAHLDPYLLGLLIGDGCFRLNSLHFCTADQELLEAISRIIPYSVRLKQLKGNNGYDWSLIGERAGRKNCLIAQLRNLGLWGKGSHEKYIPTIYKFASAKTRLAVLQGILDTDACVRPADNNIEFCTTSEQLAYDVRFLVQTLGGTARVRTKRTPKRLAYRMSIILPRGITPFRLSRKAEIYHPREKYPPARAIRSVKLVGCAKTQCIAVDAPDHLYVTDDCILTHNTIQTIAALRILLFQQQITSALLVCPASLIAQWRRELGRWAPDLKVVTITGSPAERGSLWRIPAHVVLISYETLRADVLDLSDSPALRTRWDVVVLDEASRIKNRESGIAHACKRLPRERRWALTGTPLENRLEDILSLLEFLRGEPGTPVPIVPTASNLRSQLRALQLRRKKADVLADLPPKQVHELVVELPEAQRAAYEQAEREGIVRLTQAGAAVTITHVLELIVKLKQLCNVDPVSGESAKLADIAQRLRTLVAEGHRALLFSQFTDETFGVGRAAAALREFSPLQYTGSLSAGQKTHVVDRFLAEPRHKALLLSLRAGGVGLNLQAASYVFHLDRWWNPAIEEQADSRAHRMGQLYPVTVFRYICANTIEERIAKTLHAKQQMFQDIVDDVSLDISAALDEKELFGLFGLTAPAARVQVRPPAASFESMTGREFEEWVAGRLRQIGFQVEFTPESRDGGIDLIAHRQDALQIEIHLFVQCKNHRERIGVAAIRELRGVVPDRAAGATPVLVCPGGFTPEAIAFAEAHGVRLWGADALMQLDKQAS